MRIAIVVEAIPPYCGGGEQVAWIHAVELAKQHEVAVITFGIPEGQTSRDGLDIYHLPSRNHNLAAYCTVDRARLDACIERVSPSVIHCHMPNILSACLRKGRRLLVSTIHDGVPENERLSLKTMSKAQWLKFKYIRRINVGKSDAVTCVSQLSRDIMRSIYPRQATKFSFVPNPIYENFFEPLNNRDEGYVLNFGRQIPLKMAALLDTARLMPNTRFIFVGTGEMVRDHGLANVEFLGFSDNVSKYIDGARICVFPSLSENFPLVGLEAMARGKPVIATKRGFSEYMQHMKSGFLLDSADPRVIKDAIELFLGDPVLCDRIGREGRRVAENYRPSNVVNQYVELYQALLSRGNTKHQSASV